MKNASKKLLDILYEERYKEILRQIDREKENKNLESIKEQIEKILKENITEKEKLETIINKIDSFDELCVGEIIFYEEQFYKIGFADGFSFKAEINQELNKYNNNSFQNC